MSLLVAGIFAGFRFACDSESSFFRVVLRHEFAALGSPVRGTVFVIDASTGIHPDQPLRFRVGYFLGGWGRFCRGFPGGGIGRLCFSRPVLCSQARERSQQTARDKECKDPNGSSHAAQYSEWNAQGLSFTVDSSPRNHFLFGLNQTSELSYAAET